MKKIVCFIVSIIILTSCTASIIFASASDSGELNVSSVGVSSGAYATDEESFASARAVDYGVLTFDEKISEYLTDGKVSTFWENTGSFGRNPMNPDISEYLIIDLGEIKKIDKLQLKSSNHGGFPEKLFLEYSVSEYDVRYNVAGSYVTFDKAPTANSNIDITFGAIIARYLIVNFQRTFLNTSYTEVHKVNIYDVCVADLKVFGTEATQTEKDVAIEKESNRILNKPKVEEFMADTSSVLDTKYEDGTYAYDPSNLLDGNLLTSWMNSFSATSDENCKEYVTIQNVDTEAIDFREITLYAQLSCDFFPKDFVIQYSFDGLNWLDVEGQKYTNYTDVTGQEWKKIQNRKQTFVFEKPIIAKYIRIYMTKKSGAYDASMNADYYMINLAEIEILACEADPADVVAAETKFWDDLKSSNGGNDEKTLEIRPSNWVEPLFISLSAILAVSGVALTLIVNLVKKENKND